MPKIPMAKKVQKRSAYSPDESTQAVFETGNVVGDLACELFSYGSLRWQLTPFFEPSSAQNSYG
jgi:hypothetical protein